MLSHQAGAVHLHQLALAQHADGGVEPADQAGHGGLAGAGVAHEDHVQAHGRHGQLMLLPELADLHQVHQVLDVLLDLFQAHQVLQLGHEAVKIGLLGLFPLGLGLWLGLAAGGLRLGLVLVLEAGLAAGHVVQGVQALPALAHAGGVADGGEAIRAVGDIGGLGIGHVVIHRGQIQQDVGGHADKGAGGLAAPPGVALRQVPEEHRGHEHVLPAGGAGQVPQQPGGLGLSPGIDLVCHLHMALADAAGPAPEAQGALGHKLVQLLGQVAAADAVKGVGIGQVDLVKLLGGAVPGGRHSDSLLSVFGCLPYHPYYNDYMMAKSFLLFAAPLCGAAKQHCCFAIYSLQ